MRELKGQSSNKHPKYRILRNESSDNVDAQEVKTDFAHRVRNPTEQPALWEGEIVARIVNGARNKTHRAKIRKQNKFRCARRVDRQVSLSMSNPIFIY
jgi:hypothetical protein